MTVVRVLISSFVLILIVVSVAGWIWTGRHQPAAQSVASHVVLGLGIVAGILGLVTIWRARPAK
jgi:hypothetical protein